MGLYPTAEIARKRLNRLRKRRLVHRVGDVRLNETTEFLWFCGSLSCRQHEAEITEMLLQAHADLIRRLFDVDAELRCDAEIVVAGVSYPLEHESSGTLNLRQIREKMDRYGDRTVLWTCTKRSYLDKLAGYAPTTQHLFTLYPLAVERFNDAIWVDREGRLQPPPWSVQSPVQ